MAAAFTPKGPGPLADLAADPGEQLAMMELFAAQLAYSRIHHRTGLSTTRIRSWRARSYCLPICSIVCWIEWKRVQTHVHSHRVASISRPATNALIGRSAPPDRSGRSTRGMSGRRLAADAVGHRCRAGQESSEASAVIAATSSWVSLMRAAARFSLTCCTLVVPGIGSALGVR